MPRRRALVLRKRARANDFISEIGKLMEPDQWNTSWIDTFKKNQSNANDQASRTALYVVDQLIQAVRLGIAEPELRLTEQQQTELTSVVNQEEPPTPANEVRCPSDEDLFGDDEPWFEEEPEPKFLTGRTKERSETEPGFYKIDKQFWHCDDTSTNIDWTTSLVNVPVRFIIVNKRETQEARTKRAGMRYISNGILYFRNPDAVISRLTAVPPAPSRVLLDRYTSTQTYFWAELIAATWRFIAIEGPNPEHGVGVRLVEHLRHYGELNGLWEPDREPAQSMMNTVVSQIIRQWEAGETDRSVSWSRPPSSDFRQSGWPRSAQNPIGVHNGIGACRIYPRRGCAIRGE